MIINGKIVELTRDEIKKYNEKQNAVHSMITTDKSERYSTQEQWDAYWDTINQSFYYPPGKWKEARQYLERAGYTFEEACDMLLHGYILDENGMLIDAPAIDLADLIRMADGEYVFNSSDIRALKDSLTLAYKSADAQSAALNVSKNIAYDPK